MFEGALSLCEDRAAVVTREDASPLHHLPRYDHYSRPSADERSLLAWCSMLE